MDVVAGDCGRSRPWVFPGQGHRVRQLLVPNPAAMSCCPSLPQLLCLYCRKGVGLELKFNPTNAGIWHFETVEMKNSTAAMFHGAFSRLPALRLKHCFPGLSHLPALAHPLVLPWLLCWLGSAASQPGRPLVLMRAIFPGGLVLGSSVYATPLLTECWKCHNTSQTLVVTSGTCWGEKSFTFVLQMLTETFPGHHPWAPSSCVWHILLHFWLHCLSFLPFFFFFGSLLPIYFCPSPWTNYKQQYHKGKLDSSPNFQCIREIWKNSTVKLLMSSQVSATAN